MKKFTFFFLLSAIFYIGCITDPPPTSPDMGQPNIIFILIDDIGIISTPPYSSSTDRATAWSLLNHTPHIDPRTAEPYTTSHINQFAAEAKRLNYMYATPSCAPSRAQLLTGQYPFNTGIIFPAFGSHDCTTPDSAATPQYPGTGYLANSEITYANKLQELGYYTGFGGKYNLRYGMTDSIAQAQGEDCYNEMVHNQMLHLNAHGFDETFGPTSIDIIKNGNDTVYSGGLALIGNTVAYHPLYADDQFFPTMLLDWGTAFIKKRKQENQPYYLHYCLGLIHDSAPEAFPYMSDSEEFAAKVQLADTIIGEIWRLVKDDPNTVVIIAGDNGTETYTSDFGPGYATSYHQDTIPGGKLTYESRGSRVPFLIRWPNMIDTAPYDALVDFTDVFGTIYEMAGGTGVVEDVDGRSFLHAITNGKKGKNYPPRQAIFSQMQEGGFVANKNYLFKIEDVYSDSTGRWFDISSSPNRDKPIKVHSVNPADREMLKRYYLSLGTIGLAKN